MKKLVIGLLMIMIVGGICFANSLPQAGKWPLSSDLKIYNGMAPAAGTVFGLTMEAGAVVSLNIHAIGGDLKWNLGGTTTEAYWTINEDQSYWDHYAVPLAKNTVLYFIATTTEAQAQVLLNYR